MTEDETPSERLVAQRLRNRIMEELWGLSRGDAEVRESGSIEWSEAFFDWFPYEGEPEQYPLMTPEEEHAVKTVCKLMQLAIKDPAISKDRTVDQIVDSGWPERIAPFAKKALDLMVARGRFSDDVEEVEPSATVVWP